MEFPRDNDLIKKIGKNLMHLVEIYPRPEFILTDTLARAAQEINSVKKLAQVNILKQLCILQLSAKSFKPELMNAVWEQILKELDSTELTNNLLYVLAKIAAKLTQTFASLDPANKVLQSHDKIITQENA